MILLYAACFFIGLFILYAVSRHDFVLLRQSISLRQVYDNVFIGLLVFFLVSRVGFAFYTMSFDLLNPLRFFYLTKYWGILPYAGLIGMVITLLILFRKKKNKLRILDIYLLSFTPVILLDVVLRSNTSIVLLVKVISLMVLVVFYGWFIKIHNKYTTKDGFITCMTIITYTLVSLALSIASNGLFSQRYLWFNALLVISTIVSSVILMLVQRDFFNKN